MTRLVAVVVILLLLAFTPLSCRPEGVKVGSKKFTESVVLGESISLLVGEADVSATHYRELGGTQLVFQALVSGDIDVYPEYKGTIAKEILAGRNIESDADMQSAKARTITRRTGTI